MAGLGDDAVGVAGDDFGDARELAQRGLHVETGGEIVEREMPVSEVANKRTGEFQPEKLRQRGVSIPDPDAPERRIYLWADRGWDYNPGQEATPLEALLAQKLAQAAPCQVPDDYKDAYGMIRGLFHPPLSWPGKECVRRALAGGGDRRRARHNGRWFFRGLRRP